MSQGLGDFRQAVAQLLQALRCKPEGRGFGFNLEFKIWIFSFSQFLRPHYGPGVDQASNRNEYQEYFVGSTRVGTLIVTTIYLQLIKNRYMFRSFTVLQCSHQHCVQPVASDVEVIGYLYQRLLC